MRLVKPHPRIYLFLGDSPADLGRPFVRLQEFYESPSKLFRRKLFTLKKFKDWYCRTQSVSGKFTYYRDYFGYNVPGDIANAFFCLYADQLTSDEISLLKMLDETSDGYYVIGAPADSAETVDHELSHALFYLYPEYRKTMVEMFEGYDLRGVRRYLNGNMYAEPQFDDEIVSYVMFDDSLLHAAGISTKHLRGLRGGMLGVYQSYKSRFIKL